MVVNKGVNIPHRGQISSLGPSSPLGARSEVKNGQPGAIFAWKTEANRGNEKMAQKWHFLFFPAQNAIFYFFPAQNASVESRKIPQAEKSYNRLRRSILLSDRKKAGNRRKCFFC
jgi:hypothetical protein